jgi:hypothetical protein
MPSVTNEIVGILVAFPHVTPTATWTLTGYLSHPVRFMVAVEKGIGLFVTALDDVDKQMLVTLRMGSVGANEV